MSRIQLLSYVLLAVIVGNFCFQAHAMFMERSNWLMFETPEPVKHWSDEMVFLRTFQFMRKGINYYQAIQQATIEDQKVTSYSTNDVFTWRMPTVFYLWSMIASNGTQIGLLFIVLSSCSLLSTYFIARKFLNPLFSLLSPLLLAPYALDAFYYGPFFLATEWWGLFFFIPGLCALLYKKSTVATVLFSLAVVTRELFMIPVFSLFLISLWLHTNRAVFVKTLFIFCIFFFIHFLIVQQQPVIKSVNNPDSRIHSFSKVLFQREIAFSMRLYPLLKLKLPLVLFATSIVALCIQARKQSEALYLLGSYVPFAFISPFIGGPYNNYWGLLFMPCAIAFAPIILGIRKSGASRRQ